MFLLSHGAFFKNIYIARLISALIFDVGWEGVLVMEWEWTGVGSGLGVGRGEEEEGKGEHLKKINN